MGGLDADEAKYQQKLASVVQRMRRMGLPPWLRKRVLVYYDMMRDVERCSSDKEADAFISDLSPALQADVKLCLFHTLISKVPFFNNPQSERTRLFLSQILGH